MKRVQSVKSLCLTSSKPMGLLVFGVGDIFSFSEMIIRRINPIFVTLHGGAWLFFLRQEQPVETGTYNTVDHHHWHTTLIDYHYNKSKSVTNSNTLLSVWQNFLARESLSHRVESREISNSIKLKLEQLSTINSIEKMLLRDQNHWTKSLFSSTLKESKESISTLRDLEVSSIELQEGSTLKYNSLQRENLLQILDNTRVVNRAKLEPSYISSSISTRVLLPQMVEKIDSLVETTIENSREKSYYHYKNRNLKMVSKEEEQRSSSLPNIDIRDLSFTHIKREESFQTSLAEVEKMVQSRVVEKNFLNLATKKIEPIATISNSMVINQSHMTKSIDIMMHNLSSIDQIKEERRVELDGSSFAQFKSSVYNSSSRENLYDSRVDNNSYTNLHTESKDKRIYDDIGTKSVEIVYKQESKIERTTETKKEKVEKNETHLQSLNSPLVIKNGTEIHHDTHNNYSEESIESLVTTIEQRVIQKVQTDLMERVEARWSREISRRGGDYGR